MKLICSCCESNLTPEGIEKGFCSECDYEFNPKQAAWELESPEQYRGTFVSRTGEDRSIAKMAEQLLQGKILKRFGVFVATTEGVECLDHYYHIGKEELNQPHWIDHMSGKVWVNIEEFKGALQYARENS